LLNDKDYLSTEHGHGKPFGELLSQQLSDCCQSCCQWASVRAAVVRVAAVRVAAVRVAAVRGAVSLTAVNVSDCITPFIGSTHPYSSNPPKMTIVR
jgi:hypothetical protein